MRKTPKSIRVVAEYLKCSKVQAIIFSMIFPMNLIRCSIDLDDLAGLMKCNPLNLGARIQDFDALINLRLIRKEPVDETRYRKLFPQAWKYHILPDLFDPILHGEPLIRKESRVETVFALLEAIIDTISNHENGVYSFAEMEREIQSVMEENKHLPLVNHIKTLDLANGSLYILLYMCHGFIQGNEETNMASMLKTIFSNLEAQITLRKSFVKGKHELQMKELVGLEEDIFRNDRNLHLTEKCIDALFSDDKLILARKDEKKNQGFVDYQDIPEKRLFFGEGEQNSLEFLEEVLKPDNFKKLTLRLEEKNMPRGVAILLYGAPGTGKTESVYQIARRTGRGIHQIVISETKSMWFGESEKLIKKVFDKYRRLVEIKEIAPILLFNEADGIFSRRKESNKSAVSQTENAIQNIILQEMEDLKGILIATTNMSKNLDKAFERRFLYKICFKKPTVESRIQIWKDKIPSLTNDETARLAEKFNFSGGQIDNIARKCLMKEVLYNTAPNLNELLAYCTEENLQTSVQPIGYM